MLPVSYGALACQRTFSLGSAKGWERRTTFDSGARSVTAEVFSPPIFAALCSANLMQAVQRLAKYKQLVAPMGLDVEVRK